MTNLPQEYVDAFVRFASHETPWSDWPQWFAANGARLCRAMDREQFRLIRTNPRGEILRFLEANGIGFDCDDPFHTELPPTDTVSETEYAIYTSLFTTNLFKFDQGITSIDDHTGIIGIDRPSFKCQLVTQALETDVDNQDIF